MAKQNANSHSSVSSEICTKTQDSEENIDQHMSFQDLATIQNNKDCLKKETMQKLDVNSSSIQDEKQQLVNISNQNFADYRDSSTNQVAIAEARQNALLNKNQKRLRRRRRKLKIKQTIEFEGPSAKRNTFQFPPATMNFASLQASMYHRSPQLSTYFGSQLMGNTNNYIHHAQGYYPQAKQNPKLKTNYVGFSQRTSNDKLHITRSSTCPSKTNTYNCPSSLYENSQPSFYDSSSNAFVRGILPQSAIHDDVPEQNLIQTDSYYNSSEMNVLDDLWKKEKYCEPSQNSKCDPLSEIVPGEERTISNAESSKRNAFGKNSQTEVFKSFPTTSNVPSYSIASDYLSPSSSYDNTLQTVNFRQKSSKNDSLEAGSSIGNEYNAFPQKPNYVNLSVTRIGGWKRSVKLSSGLPEESQMKTKQENFSSEGPAQVAESNRVAIVNNLFPSKALSRKQANIIQTHILRRIDMILNNQLPCICNSSLKYGALHVDCGDDYTVDWIVNIFHGNSNVIDRETLKVLKAAELPKPLKVAFRTQDRFTTKAEDLLKRLNRFNPNLKTEGWNVLKRSNEAGFMRWIFEVGPDVVETIKQADFGAFTGLDFGTFTVISPIKYH